jgi:hypothetical protein
MIFKSSDETGSKRGITVLSARDPAIDRRRPGASKVRHAPHRASPFVYSTARNKSRNRKLQIYSGVAVSRPRGFGTLQRTLTTIADLLTEAYRAPTSARRRKSLPAHYIEHRARLQSICSTCIVGQPQHPFFDGSL